ncbi:MAG: hypothetical protein NC293_02245 [Roseburia sp.]|nr:hypothetical protein [Roseburia sp.]
MAGFFDKVSDVINNTANDISDKAKEFSEVSSLNGQIRSQEKLIENAYREIGKSYYEAHANATEDAYLEQLQTITEAKKTAEKLREDVANIKGK